MCQLGYIIAASLAGLMALKTDLAAILAKAWYQLPDT